MKKILFCLFFLLQINIELSVLAQSVPAFQDTIPLEYKAQFKVDQKKYEDYMRPNSEGTGRTFNLWNFARKGELKGYDLDSLYSIYKSLKEEQILRQVEFIKENSSSYASMYNFNIYLLNSLRLHPDSLLAVYSVFSKDLQNTPAGKSIYESIKRKKGLLIGNLMHDFTFSTLDGQNFSLSSFRNSKNILICYWASWCGPCISNIPFLKEMHNEFSDKDLQIISISIDKDEKKWKDAANKYTMPWLQTCDLPTYIKNQSIRTLYEVNFIPQYYLINKEGRLIYQSFQIENGSDDNYPELRKILNQIYK